MGARIPTYAGRRAAPGRYSVVVARADQVDPLLAELGALVGLEEVKREIARRVAVHRLNAERASAGEPVLPERLHLAFGGDPGTGEAEVARLVAALYAALGLLPTDRLVEVTPLDLVGADEAATVAQVQGVIAQAMGGVLFVDEAPLLLADGPEGQGPVALAALVTGMAGDPPAFAVILAGPTEPMRLIVERHPLLQPIFDEVIEFPRYTPDQLLEILRLQIAELRIDLPDDVAAALLEHLAAVHATGQFRSARYLPALVEEMYGRLAERAGADGADGVRAFAVEDVPAVEAAHFDEVGVRVGFSRALGR